MPGALDFLKQRLAELERAGTPAAAEDPRGTTGARARFDGRDVINLASNNYLGLANHPRMNAAASKAASELGAGTGAVRTIAGIDDAAPRARAAVRRLQARGGRADVPVGVHGERRDRRRDPRQAGRDRERPPEPRVDHRRRAALARRDQGVRAQGRRPRGRACSGRARPRAGGSCWSRTACSRWTATSRRCPTLVEVAERHGAIMMIDDAHASGVLGKGGAGTVDHFGLHGRVDVQVGTLSKAIGVLGGFIAGPARADRVAAEPGPALPVLDERATGGGRGVHRGARHHRGRARAARSPVVEHRDRSRRGCTSSGSTRGRARRRSRR